MINKIENLSVKKISKSYGSNLVFSDISFSCKAGSITGIIGYNGCGKSVLFKCICGFEHVDSGAIYVNEKERQKGKLLESAGIIIEDPAFLKKKSGFNNLKYLYMIKNKINKNYLYEVMEKVGLDPRDKKEVGKYSLGMKQRLAIGQAIMEDPDILILDEPMNGLDKKGVQDIRSILLKLKEEGKIILLASHNKDDITILCDDVYEIDNGILYPRVLCEGGDSIEQVTQSS